MVGHYGSASRRKCEEIVDAALQRHDWRVVDQVVGQAIEIDAHSVGFVAGKLGVAKNGRVR